MSELTKTESPSSIETQVLVSWLQLLIEERLISEQILDWEERLAYVRAQKEVVANKAGRVGMKLGMLQDPVRNMNF
jgi:hypothetical protein